MGDDNGGRRSVLSFQLDDEINTDSYNDGINENTIIQQHQQVLSSEEKDDDDDEEEEKGAGGFFACYLLVSLSPRYKGHTYIGFTVNPKRRIKQHNGELRCGAFRTKSKRPWEMALCIYGFPTNVAALQFEWAWQHPTESLAVRKAACEFKSLSGIANKVKLAFTMLTLPAWQSMNLTVNFFSTKYQKHCAGCPRLPEQMNMQIGSMDELPCYTEYGQNVNQQDMESDIEEIDVLAEENRQCVGPGYNEVNETIEYSTVPNNVECRKRNKKATTTFGLNIGSSDLIQQRRTSQTNNHHTQPSSTDKPLEEAASSSHVAEILLRSTFPIEEACSIDLVSPVGKGFSNRSALGKDKIIIKDPAFLSNVEVVDLSTPEPGCKTSLQAKKGGSDSSKYIDLTESPMFV